MLSAGKKCEAKKALGSHTDENKAMLRDLISKRRSARKDKNAAEVRRLSKLIQKELKVVAKGAKTFKVAKLLEEFKDLGQLADIRNKGRKQCITSIVDKEGKECSNLKDIAEVFADFYESLYSERPDRLHAYTFEEEIEAVDPVTAKEVRAQLKKMKKNKAADDSGIVAELLCEASDSLIEDIAELFTEILKPRSTIPESWRASSIRVLFKKGDPKLPGNYRPVCIIPILYKVFSKMLCGRIMQRLLEEQSWDQAGFRPDFSCEDHLFTMTMIADKCKEFNIPLWVAAIDFSKAFDSIHHGSIFKALKEQGVPLAYVEVMARLYKEQHASVQGECRSRAFPISKGTKQGDPISPLIFNAVLEMVMRKVKDKWKIRKYGFDMMPSVEERLTNLRFADDILLIGRTLPQIKQMLVDVAEECAKVGLSLHPEKTKILHNNMGYGRHVKAAKAGEMVIEVLGAESSTMYLGKLLSLVDPHDVEVQHRTKKAWAKFALYREELTDKGVPLKLRLKLFNAVVTPTMLYACSAWVLTAAQEKKVQATQMRMTRSILGRKRKIDSESGEKEPWVPWIKRTTAEARENMKMYNVRNWTEILHAKKRTWKARLEKLDPQKWASQALEWQPIGFRKVGRPAKRWQEEGDQESHSAKED